jgi:hypothetical protein
MSPNAVNTVNPTNGALAPADQDAIMAAIDTIYRNVYKEPQRHEDTKKAGTKRPLMPAFFVSSCLCGSLYT